MAVENAGKSALSVIMGTAENPADGMQTRALLMLLMIIGICLSGYVINEKYRYVKPEKLYVAREEPTADINRLNAMIRNLNAANTARMNSMEVAISIASMARYPFVAERLSTVEVDSSGYVSTVVIVPPYIRVRGTMLLEGKSVAILDIEGEPSGRIFKVGDKFADAKGRISRISPDKITIVYEGKEFVFTP